jgi:maltooligosyltrehalose trehalohydrolase
MILPNNLGATYLGGDRVHFCVWAPSTQTVEVHLVGSNERRLPLQREYGGYYQATFEGVKAGSLYFYRLDGNKEHPDPASRFQPQGVHGPSQVVDSSFAWEDISWPGLPLDNYVIYELHVGTFTPEGTFEAVITHLDELKRSGITAVELMPVAQFPGNRNWGYDGVYPFAAQNSYGGYEGLKRLVNACHQKGMAVLLDVVYNHLGPEGNYLGDFGPYFTRRYSTPWGLALNFDGDESDAVRRFFIENALYWVAECHVDALRLDAIHAILDHSPEPFVEELALAVHHVGERLNRRIHVIAESHLNDARLVRSRELGGYGLDAVWNDDFHHTLHTLLTGERSGYYQDFGKFQHLAKSFREGFVYTGEYAPFWRRRRGVPSRDIPAQRFVVFAQNHDQVGNRVWGERLSHLASFESLKLAAGVVLLSPFIPLLFMGEEYGETAPFQYFISHTDPALIEAVRRGRREEFSAFLGQEEPPDPQDEATFQRAKLNHHLRHDGDHGVLLEFYMELMRLRRELPALANLSKEHLEVTADEGENILFLRRWQQDSQVLAVFNFADASSVIRLPLPHGQWRKLLDSAARRWHGPGSAVPDSLYSMEEGAVTLSSRALILCSLEGTDQEG